MRVRSKPIAVWAVNPDGDSIFSAAMLKRQFHPMTEESSTHLPPPAADADILLMERVKQGDLEAFNALIEMHQYRVVATVARMLGDDMDAEDIAQQVFIRVWKSAPKYQPSARFTTWLFTITRNLVFNELRRRKRHSAISMEQDENTPALQIADTEVPSPSDAVLDVELQHAIQTAIDSLPETQRLAIILRRYEEMPYEEIGRVLDLSVPAVKSVLFRARTDLREKLRKYLGT